MDTTLTTLIDTRDAIASSALTAVAATTGFLERIEGHQALNALTQTLADRALARAADVDAGRVTGPLAGVPIAIKDNLCTTFGRTTCASRMLEHYVSPYTATAVQRLEAAGAIIVGKANMDEFAMGSSTENSAFAPTRNPWQTDHVPGGSSGGAAVAVAADLAAGAIGSDTGGSIRQPAALCGVVGLKPTYGRVSRFGLVAFASSLDQIGPLGHTVADVAALLEVIAGPDPRDATCADVPTEAYGRDLERAVPDLRVGMARQFDSEGNHPAVARAVTEAATVLRDAGARIVEIDLPHTDYGIPTYYIVCMAEASSNLARYDGIHYGHRTAKAEDLIDLYCRSRAEGFGDEVKRRIMLGTYALSSGYYDAYYLRALKVRRLIKRDFDAAFERCDVILGPTTPGPAFRLGQMTADPLQMYLNDIYTVNANLAGICAISLPAGTTQVEGGAVLPVAVQLLGPPFQEARLLRAARMFEAATPYHQLRPPIGP